MAFDNSQPEDTTKIRNLGTVIRPNWVAIEDGGSTFQPKAINFTNRTVSGPSNDPTAIANTFIVFCKEDASGNPELYGINESSDVIQFTSGTPTLAQPESNIFLVGGMILKLGLSSFAGASTTKVVTYATPFPNNSFGVSMTLIGDAIGCANEDTSEVTHFTATRANGAVDGLSFHWIAWGM